MEQLATTKTVEVKTKSERLLELMQRKRELKNEFDDLRESAKNSGENPSGLFALLMNGNVMDKYGPLASIALELMEVQSEIQDILVLELVHIKRG